MINKILYTTDFSPSSAQAFPYALDLAQKHKAKLYIVTVYEVPLGAPSSMFTSREATMKKVAAEKYALAVNNLEKYFSEYLLGEVHWEHKAIEGLAPDQILKFQKANNIDLVVMGTHGKTGNQGLFMGSVANQVVQDSTCPVLVVPPLVNYKYPNNIAYASDLKGKESKMIQFVIGLAKKYYSKLIFVHVDEQTGLEEESNKKLKEKVEALDYPMVDYYDVVNSDLADGLLGFIEEHEVDWLAMTTHTTSILDKLFHNSLTTRMLKNSPVPLLVFNQFKSDIIVL